MGTKIEMIRILFLFILFFSMKVLGQNKLLEVKKYALNKCINYNYQKIDSTFYNTYKDVSGIQISINGNFLEDAELKAKIIDYTINTTGLYYLQKNNIYFETGEKNIIFCNCLKFYESKRLNEFIKNLLKK